MGGPWGWFYVAVRTFPFWAIPLSFTLFAAGIRAKKAKSTFGRKGAFWYHLLAILLLILSGAYLYFQGHQHAVPFFYNAINQKP